MSIKLLAPVIGVGLAAAILNHGITIPFDAAMFLDPVFVTVWVLSSLGCWLAIHAALIGVARISQ